MDIFDAVAHGLGSLIIFMSAAAAAVIGLNLLVHAVGTVKSFIATEGESISFDYGALAADRVGADEYAVFHDWRSLSDQDDDDFSIALSVSDYIDYREDDASYNAHDDLDFDNFSENFDRFQRSKN